MKYDFYLPTNLVTGKDAVKNNSQLLKELGDCCLIVTSGSAAEKSGALQDITEALEAEEISFDIWNTVQQNPLLENAYAAGEKAKEIGANFIIGIGGGSPLDASKAVAVYAANDFPLLDIYNYHWSQNPLPIVTVGTTAGTGSEVTPYAIMTTPSGRKQSISHPQCFPVLTYGDAKYTTTLSVEFTISTALDALAHAVEGYYSTAAGLISDLFAREAITHLASGLKDFMPYSTGDVIPFHLREELYYASLSAGFTLALCGTTYCHTLGYFLTEEYEIPHGQACALYLPGFLQRQSALLPEKSRQLEKQSGFSIEELSALITHYLVVPAVTLSLEEIVHIVDSKKESANFKKTAPQGLTFEEGIDIMTALFEKP